LRGIELIGYGAGAGVVIQGLFGWGLAANVHFRPIVIAEFLICPLIALFYIWWRGVLGELRKTLSRGIAWSLSLWMAFLILCVGITQLQVQFPETLGDGFYVFKQHHINVKIQYMTTLPADNYIAYVVTEYLLRHISFKTERPIMPATEVSNRTILMPLVAMPFRATLGVSMEPRHLGTFHYVGQDWPDVEKLYDDAYFRQFLVVAIVLNGLLLLGLLVLFSPLQSAGLVAVGMLLCATNPYFISQTIFTWPKSMAGFFILLSWNSLRRRHDPRLVGLCAALAYHSHPYAIVFALSLGLWYAFEWWRKRASFRPVLNFTLVFVLSILPWFIWTHFWLAIPSDMIAQNFFPPWIQITPINLVWARLNNLFLLLTPRPFSLYPFNNAAVANTTIICLPGAIGLVLAIPAFCGLTKLREEPALLWSMLVPATLIWLIFSVPNLVVLHGYQPIVGVLLFLGLGWLKDRVSFKTFWVLVALQFACNLFVIIMHGVAVGAHVG
jgi:hypothetical protein